MGAHNLNFAVGWALDLLTHRRSFLRGGLAEQNGPSGSNRLLDRLNHSNIQQPFGPRRLRIFVLKDAIGKVN
jgi:hypothetical protein